MLIRLVPILFGLLLSSCVWNEPESNPEYLTIDDSEYPYADIP